MMPDPNDLIEFSEFDFSLSCSFSGFIFFECQFIRSIFRGTVDFIGCSFQVFSNFSGTKFIVGANFKNSMFEGVSFKGVEFSRGGAFFNNTSYGAHADFSHIKFPETVHFHRAAFKKSADFKCTRIGGYLDFREANFGGWAGFQGAEFAAEVDFTDTEFQAPTNFDSCRFEKCPPQLDGATLHQRTNWRRVTWPSLQGLELRQVEDLTDAYSCIKLEMDKQKRHHDELMFFSKELECRKVEQGKVKGFPISLYAWTCDYGQNIILPMIWLIDLILLCWNIIMLTYMPEITWDKALLASIANSFGSFGVRKELMESLTKAASTGMQMFLMLQGIVALILIFLIGLGLRNRFRMK